MRKFNNLAIIATVLLFIVACKTTQPIYNVAEKTIAAGTMDASKVKQAILNAAKFKRWSVKEESDNRIVLAINVRRHYAEIAVDYSESSYGITYSDSQVLDHKNGQIHRNYNKWIKLLEQEIDRELTLVQ